MNNCQSPQQAACGNMLLEVFESKEVLRFYFSDVGESGLSAYEVALQEGFIGAVDEWLESLVGPPVPLAQELGDDPNLAVSQKLLKDSIDAMELSNESMVQEAERLNSLSQQASESAGQSAANAELAKQAAELSASQASSSESNSAQSAKDAEQSALSASSSAAQSTQSAIESKSSANQAKNSSDESAASAQESLESAQGAKLSEQNALASEQAADLSAQAAAESESNAKASEQNAASSAQQSADSAAESAAQAVLAGESELSAKGHSEQAGVDADRSEAAADRAEDAATLVEDKLDKSSVKDELGDSKEFVINQSKVTEMFQLFAGWLDLPKADAYADFENNRYFKDGMPCRFEDIFGFERLSEATTFSEDGLKVWGVDEPRVVEGKGLLVEPESTNLSPSFVTVEDWSATSKVGVHYQGEQVFELEEEGFKYFNGIVSARGGSGLYYSLFLSNLREDREVAFYHSASLTDASYIGYDSVSSKGVGYIASDIYNGAASIAHRRDGQWTTSGGVGRPTVRVIKDGEADFMGDSSDSVFTFNHMQVTRGMSITPVLASENQVSRLPDILSLPSGYTVSGDYDEGVEVDGNQVSGFGYIRKLILEKK